MASCFMMYVAKIDSNNESLYHTLLSNNFFTIGRGLIAYTKKFSFIHDIVPIQTQAVQNYKIQDTTH